VETRLARLDDAAAIAAIYNHAVTTSTAVFDLRPRTLAEQQEWLTSRSGVHAVIVATEQPAPGSPVLGFASLSPYRDRPAYATSVESSVYVHPDHVGQGIGRVLLQRLVEVATDHGFHAMIARIADGNEASIALHTAVGFELVGREREVGRKFGRWLDVVVMQRLLS
jgi:phosphinothricin acetyltransferase